MTIFGKNGVERSSGFTLLELMVVMTILAGMAMMVTLVFSDSLKSIRMENAARDLFAAMNYAHNRAIVESTEYRLYIQPKTNTYWLMYEGVDEEGYPVFIPVDELRENETTLPDSLEMNKSKARSDRQNKAHYIAFYPNGVCDTASFNVAVADRKGRTYRFWTEGVEVRWEKPAR